MKIKTKRVLEQAKKPTPKPTPKKTVVVVKKVAPVVKQMVKCTSCGKMAEKKLCLSFPKMKINNCPSCTKASAIPAGRMAKPVPSKVKKPQVKKPIAKPVPKAKKLVVIRKPMVQSKLPPKRDPDRIEMAPHRGRIDRCKCKHSWALHHIQMTGVCSEVGCECKGFESA